MKKTLGLTFLTCFALIGCTKQSPKNMPTPSVQPEIENAIELSIVSVERAVSDNTLLIINFQWSVDKGRVFYDYYNLDYHYKINEESWKNNGPIRWRHPFRGVKEITPQAPYYNRLYLDLGNRNLDTIKHIQVKVTHYKRVQIEILKKSSLWTDEKIEQYKKAWFGSLSSQRYQL